MPAYAAHAPGKAILFGEHAVVYGRPAIAVPVEQVRATAVATPGIGLPAGKIRIEAPDVGVSAWLDELPPADPLATTIRGVFAALGVSRPPAMTIKVTSTIPVASGLGSGAAVSVAVIRAIAALLGSPMPDETVCQLAYAVEQIHHGTPSGIDNTVITYRKPVYFMRGQPIETLAVPRPFTLVIADSGQRSLTSQAVGGVRERWQADPPVYERLFDQAGEIAQQARVLIEQGQTDAVGSLMDANHAVLREMGVSIPMLDRLVEAAREAGALGAKLSGAGAGGNMIALAQPERTDAICAALKAAGATGTLVTRVSAA